MKRKSDSGARLSQNWGKEHLLDNEDALLVGIGECLAFLYLPDDWERRDWTCRLPPQLLLPQQRHLGNSLPEGRIPLVLADGEVGALSCGGVVLHDRTCHEKRILDEIPKVMDRRKVHKVSKLDISF